MSEWNCRNNLFLQCVLIDTFVYISNIHTTYTTYSIKINEVGIFVCLDRCIILFKQWWCWIFSAISKWTVIL